MATKWQVVAASYRQITEVLERWAVPVVDLLGRAALFRVFFYSGLSKIANWEGTVQLFAHEYQVPLLPPALAAMLATSTELVASTLVLVGLGTRIAALPMLEMAIIIQFWVGAVNPAFNRVEHFFWMVLLLAVICRGPGKLSLDYLISRRCPQ
ncbi:MAG: DoxX family membrane protein [Azospirillum sp.]|nr:DoxX family membrane protein [Azospirillum sp.]